MMNGSLHGGVVVVDRPHAVLSVFQTRGATHLLLGLAGLVVVLGTFWTAYTAVVGLTLDLLGTLSSAAIVWLFLVAWIVVWVGLEMLVEFAS